MQLGKLSFVFDSRLTVKFYLIMFLLDKKKIIKLTASLTTSLKKKYVISYSLNDRIYTYFEYLTFLFSFRCAGDYAQAKKWHERQLDVALAARDKVNVI